MGKAMWERYRVPGLVNDLEKPHGHIWKRIVQCQGLRCYRTSDTSERTPECSNVSFAKLQVPGSQHFRLHLGWSSVRPRVSECRSLFSEEPLARPELFVSNWVGMQLMLAVLAMDPKTCCKAGFIHVYMLISLSKQIMCNPKPSRVFFYALPTLISWNGWSASLGKK